MFLISILLKKRLGWLIIKFGLAGSLFTKDMSRVLRYAEMLEAGMVHVGGQAIGGEAQLPFGGVESYRLWGP